MLRVELPAFFEKDEIHSLGAELVIAKAFATAATAASTSSYECVRLEFSYPGASWKISTDFHQDRSKRAIRDAFLRLVDRALARVYPPIDVLRYLSDRSPQFTWDGFFAASFFFQTILPYAYGFSHPCQTCDVHGALYTVEGAAAPFFSIKSDLQTEVDVLKRESSLAGSIYQCDSELWIRAKLSGERARVEYNHQKGSDDCAESSRSVTSGCLDPEGDTHEEETIAYIAERLGVFHKKASLWLTERIANEGSWAKSSGSFSPTNTRDRKRGRQGMQGGNATSASSPRVHFKPNILAAAAASFPLPSRGEKKDRLGKGNTEGRGSLAVSKASPGWMLHLDVRGIEFDAVCVAQTARYAYVACPYWDPNAGNTASPHSAAEAGVRRGAADSSQGVRWCLVARLPIPSYLASMTAAVEGEEGKGDAPDAFPNTHPFAEETPASPRGDHFLQLSEASKFDNSSPLRELREECKRLVTVRAHGVRCRRLSSAPPNTSPFMYHGAPLFLWFEDAYLLGQGPFLPYGAPGEAKAGVYGGVLCSDLVELVEASCRRYLRTCEKMSRYVRANPIPFRAEGPPKCQDVDATDSLDCCGEGGKDCSSTNDAALKLRTKLRLGKERLVAKAETVFSSMTDTRSVYYKKLRSKPFNSVPLISTSRDVEGLFEGPTVEFKHHLSHYRPATKQRREDGAYVGKNATAIMDVERIRHTIAAMASTMGGVLCVGVTDEGEVVGHERGEVVQMLRTTGFCPAMVAGSVVAKELPVLNVVSTRNASTTELATSIKAMPKDWWKMPSTSLSAAYLGEGEGSQRVAHEGGDDERRCGGEVGMTLQAHFGKVVTVITVSKGSAPFYASGRAVLPYLRGCASTVRMPALVMARRLAEQFEGEAIYDS
ncbi:unnamed protein product [Phytomonas sp. EM1]|nr:unnamed protein product [Phytomonas sp. EM1]|eukprot:CCW60944.1 unnamed protein product [Phytomonas sp. isolate EM1]